MIYHTSVWRLKPGTPDDVIDQIVTEWRGLEALIPEIRSITVGRDVGVYPENCTVAAHVGFDSIDGYSAYRVNPIHDEFSARLLVPNIRDLGDRFAVQYDPAG